MKYINGSKSNLHQVFTVFDDNNNGRMGFDSFRRMVKSISKDISDDEIKMAFDFIDTDGSKTI